jgi:hypothetical protein
MGFSSSFCSDVIFSYILFGAVGLPSFPDGCHPYEYQPACIRYQAGSGHCRKRMTRGGIEIEFESLTRRACSKKQLTSAAEWVKDSLYEVANDER